MGKMPLSPEQREKRRAYHKAWQEAHRAERRAYNKQWREENRARFTGMNTREVPIAASWHIAQAALRLSAAKKVRIYTGGNMECNLETFPDDALRRSAHAIT